jgi:putrescine transport system ATP-binding protein
MDIQQELHLTFVIVTHDQEEAMTVADRIAVMDAGKIMQVATPPEIYEQPATRYVADFIGDINLVPVTVTSKSDAGYDLSAAELSVPIVSRDDRDLQLSSSAHFALRPEKLTVSHDPPENQKTNCAAGEVWDIGYVGDVSIVHVKLDSGFVFKSLVMNSARLVERPVSWGDRVWLSWADDAGLVLLS